MSRTPADEIVRGYIQEVEGYLAPLREGIAAFRDDPEARGALEEVHRMVHTIKGASAMLDMEGLSRMALQMEDAVEALLDGRLAMDDALHDAMTGAVDRFEVYCRDFQSVGVDGRALLAGTLADFARSRGDDGDGDPALLADVPEREGGPSAVGTSERADDFAADFDDLLADEPAPDDDSLMPDDGPLMPNGPPDGPPEWRTAEAGVPAVPAEDAAFPEPAEADLLESFYEEAEDHLQEMGRSLDDLAAGVTAPMAIGPGEREPLRRIRRAVHTLKGAAGVTGLFSIADFAHRFEDLLDWLYETADRITPEAVSVLIDSADLLEGIVEAPETDFSGRIDRLRAAYAGISGGEGPAERAAPPDDDPGTDAAPPATAMALYRPGRTLRVDMARMDELVNLSGECIIAGAAFDRQMAAFGEAVEELELARNRLREIARDMEIGFEVKGLARMGSAAGGGEGPAKAAADAEAFDPLELDRYSELNLIIRTLNESVIDVGALHTTLAGVHGELEGSLNRQRVLLSELQEKMTRTRMTPMGTITHRLRRTVRDVATRLGKSVRLVVEGADIELDRGVWEKLIDPLMHILRNAADHGIESPEARRALDKPVMGTVKLAASREGNQVVIRITDDGAGLDYGAIRKAAAGAAPDRNIDRNIGALPDEEAAHFIFYPGFSTRREVSPLSGRGVGMDVVKENIQDLRGAIRVRSWRGEGTRFTIRLPLTLAAVRALLFTAGGQTYAIPLSEVSEILRISPDAVAGQRGDVVRIRDALLPLYDLATVLGAGPGPERAADGHPLVIVAEAGDRRAVLIIDGLVGQREIVIKGMGAHLRYVKGVSGVAIMGDGGLTPILNVADLIGEEPEAGAAPPPDMAASASPLRILVVDDSVSIRQVISRLMAEQGWRAETARDGVEALDRIREFGPDLIVLDIEMPRMNGYEFLNAVNAQPDLREIPVVVLTSRTAGKHRRRAMALGARGYVVKPYDDAEFIDLVSRLTQR
jgi:chemosensory pili system protein ChpA (sensor histidine kinase/response regulator)